MKIALLQPTYDDSGSPFAEYDPAADPTIHAPGHAWETFWLKKASAVRQVRELASRGFDVFFNMCDGAWEEERAGIEVVQALERLGLAFTGAGSGFYEPTRDLQKMACHYWGLPTPAHAFVTTAEETRQVATTLRFPLIVKHPNGYGSLGMGRDARVTAPAELEARAAAMIERFGSALVEEFVEGREFTVLVTEALEDGAEPLALVPAECGFPPGETFKHFDLKWVAYEGLTWNPVTDRELADRLRDLSRRLFTALAGTGYARCDLRLDTRGGLHLLEINPNCGIYYPPGEEGSTDIILRSDPLGPGGFLEHQLQLALRRQRRQARRSGVRLRPGVGYGLVALVDVQPGEVIEPYEERPHHLVTRGHVERTWSGLQREWFARYAWPLTDEVFVRWSDDPAAWRPIDHACDPNSWVTGLDLVARRRIARGEPITIDYGTFCGPDMAPFECRCGSALCRNVIRGTDHLLEVVGERYGDHVSDWVRTKRAARRR